MFHAAETGAKRNPEYDVFTCAVRLGYSAALYDWERWCLGASFFQTKAVGVLVPAGEDALFIRDPENIRRVWEVFAPEDSGDFRAYDRDGGARSETLSPREAALFRVHFPSLVKWIGKFLRINDIQRPRLCGSREDPHLLYQIAERRARIYVTRATDVRQLSAALSLIGKEQSALLLTLTDWVENSEAAMTLLSEYEVDVYSVQTFIRPRFEGSGAERVWLGYEYVFEEDFAALAADKRTLPPKATFLRRPDACGWRDLHLMIQTGSHSERKAVSRDVLYAYYARNGKKCSEVACGKIGDLGDFFYGGSGNSYYGMLKGLAASRGRENTAFYDEVDRNRLNGVRKTLRERLCKMFGYCETEPPIVQDEKDRRVFRTVFGICFTDSHSDPFDRPQSLRRLRSDME